MWFSKRAEAMGCGASPSGGKRRGNRPFWMRPMAVKSAMHAFHTDLRARSSLLLLVLPEPTPARACRSYVYAMVERSGTERGKAF